MNLRKICLWIHKKLNPLANYKISKSERYVIMIVLKILKLDNVELLLNAHKNEMYIDTKGKNIFIYVQLDDNIVTIVNHKYSYDIKFNIRSMTILQDKFEKELTKRRESLKQKYLSNTEHSLGVILNEINFINKI